MSKLEQILDSIEELDTGARWVVRPSLGRPGRWELVRHSPDGGFFTAGNYTSKRRAIKAVILLRRMFPENKGPLIIEREL